MGNIFTKCVKIDKGKGDLKRQGYIVEIREKYYIILSNNDYIEL